MGGLRPAPSGPPRYRGAARLSDPSVAPPLRTPPRPRLSRSARLHQGIGLGCGDGPPASRDRPDTTGVADRAGALPLSGPDPVHPGAGRDILRARRGNPRVATPCSAPAPGDRHRTVRLGEIVAGLRQTCE